MELAAGGAFLAPIRSAAELTQAAEHGKAGRKGLDETPHPAPYLTLFPEMQDMRNAVQAFRWLGGGGGGAPVATRAGGRSGAARPARRDARCEPEEFLCYRTAVAQISGERTGFGAAPRGLRRGSAEPSRSGLRESRGAPSGPFPSSARYNGLYRINSSVRVSDYSGECFRNAP